MKARTWNVALAALLMLSLLPAYSSSAARSVPSTASPFRSERLPADAGAGSLAIASDPAYSAEKTEAGGPRIYLAGGSFDPLTRFESGNMPPSLQVSPSPAEGAGYYLVQFLRPITAGDLDALSATGVEVFDYIPEFTFIVKMDGNTRRAVESMESVRWVGPYQPAYRISKEVLARVQTGKPVSRFSELDAGGGVEEDNRSGHARALGDDELARVMVTIFRGEALQPVIAQIEAAGGEILSRSQTSWKSKLEVSIAPSHLAELATISGVRWIEEAPAWELLNSEAAEVMGVRSVWNTHGLYGQGQTVAVCDTGLDQGSKSPSSLHDDFEDGSGNSRVVTIHDRVGDGAEDVNSGHGTHVAGSVLGNGDLSGATPSSHTYPDTAYAGMAPEASLVFQAVEDDESGALSGIPADLNELFAQASGSGAALHTNSWGSSVVGMYTGSSEEVDEYVWDHKDFTVLFAAANDGIDSNADGVVDLYSMGSPGTAKNCITVGATENDRPATGGTWNVGWPTHYPVAPIKGDAMADDIKGMAAFSSRGPALDGRYKPDIVAPGTYVVSVRSSEASSTGWGAIDGNYMYNGGTSMSTPLVAGAATLVRQFYVDEEGITPSAALIKATLVNGATDINPGQYGVGDDREIPGARPTNVAGWGRVNLENSIFPSSPREIRYEDEPAGLATGESDSYSYQVSSSVQPLRVTLAWSDYPGSPVAAGGLVNDLDLTVTGPDGGAYYPNNASQRGISQHLAYDDGAYEGGYYASEGTGVAVRFTPGSYPATLQTGLFQVKSRSGSYPKTFQWRVYDGDDSTGPDAVLASGSTTIRQDGWHAVDLSGADVTLSSGDFFLGIEMPDDDLAWYYDETSPDGRSWATGDESWSKETDEDYLFHAIVTSADVATEQDRVNNLVGVDIANPATGNYTVTISGHNVPFGPQPYALVTSGALARTTVTGITPATGVNTGTVRITDLAGTHFQSGATVKLTKLGQESIIADSPTVVSDWQITCTFDLRGVATGRWNVVVVNPDSRSGTLADGFTVGAPPGAPTVTSITPASGVNTGTVGITDLAGTNFQSGATLKLTKPGQADITANSPTVVSQSQMTCTFDLDGAVTGAWNVVVTNPDTYVGTLTAGFTVNAPSPARRIYLPVMMRRHPPYPDTPLLYAIDNADGDEDYRVSWAPADLAETYVLEEDNNAAFSTPAVRYDDAGMSWDARGKAAGVYYYRVKAHNAVGDSAWSSTQSVSVGAPVTAQLTNGDFEDGAAGWTEYSRQGWFVITDELPLTPHGGSWGAWLGGDEDELSYIEQPVTVPVGKPYLVYWHAIASEDLCGYDYGGVVIDDADEVDRYDLCDDEVTDGWVSHVVDLSAYAGQSVSLRIWSETDSSFTSNLFVDDVSFQASAPSLRRGAMPFPREGTTSKLNWVNLRGGSERE
mgnify:CR=1 FL=1